MSILKFLTQRPSPRQRSIHRRADEVEGLIERMEKFHPCPNPECTAFRREMLRIVDGIRANQT